MTAACDQPLRDDYPALAVIGGGNLGVTSAAYARARGGNCSLYIRDSAAGREKLDRLAEHDRSLPFTPPNASARTVRLDCVTSDMGEAVQGRSLIFVTVPATGHADVARSLAPHLQPDTVVVLHPGQAHGALAFVQELRDAGAAKSSLSSLAVAELCISNFTTRSSVENAAYTALKHYNLLSCFPAARTLTVESLVAEMFPTTQLHVLEDCLAMAFHPIAAGPHIILTLTNLGDLARGWEYQYYTEGANELSTRLIRRFDQERCAVARAFGYEPVDVETCLQKMYDMPDSLLPELFTENPAYHGYTSPSALNTRYFTEEIPFGVKPLLELARLVKVDAPMIRAVETLLDTLFAPTDCVFDADARTLAKLGLDHLSLDELKERVAHGSPAY